MDGTLYQLMLAIHIIAVTLWLGANVVMGLGSGRSVAASSEVKVWWTELQGVLNRTVKNAAFALLLVTGIVMVVASDDAIKMSAPFVSFGFLAVIVGGALGGAVFAPGARKIADALRQGDAAAAKSHGDRLGMIGAAESLLVVVTILFMVFRWGGLGG